MTKNDRLELRLDADLRGKIDELAKAKGVAASVVVRRAVLDAHRAAFPNAPLAGPQSPLVVPEAPCTSHPTLTDLHVSLWGRPPTHVQRQLYDLHGRGYATGVADEHIDAVIATLFYIARLRSDDPPVILAPTALHESVLARVQVAHDAAMQTEAATAIAQTIAKMRIGVPVPWPTSPLRVWVGVGIQITDDTPTWVTKRLVGVEERSTEFDEHG